MPGQNYIGTGPSRMEQFDAQQNEQRMAQAAIQKQQDIQAGRQVTDRAATSAATQGAWGRGQQGPSIPAYLGTEVTNAAAIADAENKAYGKHAATGYLGPYSKPLQYATTDLLQQADRVARDRFVPKSLGQQYESTFAPEYQAPAPAMAQSVQPRTFK